MYLLLVQVFNIYVQISYEIVIGLWFLDIKPKFEINFFTYIELNTIYDTYFKK